MISKVFSNWLKNFLFSTNQNGYVTNRFISKGERLISDNLEMTDIFNMKGYFSTIDIEKAFDSVDHYLSFNILGKFGFKKKFLRWIETFWTIRNPI